MTIVDWCHINIVQPHLQVCLQNCHLAASSLAALATVIADLPHRNNLHPSFRLWLTLAPSPTIPPSILSSGPTLVLEPPHGVRARLMHALNALPAAALDPPPAVPAHAWSRVVCAAALFHAAVSERRRYGPRAWSSQCVFTPGDLAATVTSLRSLVSGYRSLKHDTDAPATSAAPEQLSGPMKSLATAIETVIGGVHYGGRVTVESDHALLACMLRKYVVDATMQCTWERLGAGCGGGGGGAINRLLDGAAAADLEGLAEWAAVAPELESVELLGLRSDAAAALHEQAR